MFTKKSSDHFVRVDYRSLNLLEIDNEINAQNGASFKYGFYLWHRVPWRKV